MNDIGIDKKQQRYVIKRVINIAVVVQFFPWFKFYFPLFRSMVMYDNEF